MPLLGHRSVARTNASWTASSASVMSPRRWTSVATAWPYTSRNTRSTSVACRSVTVRVTSSGTRHLEEWADFDRSVDRFHDLAGPDQRCVEVVGFDDVETADMLLRLNEGPIGHHEPAVARADDGRRISVMESAGEDERTGRLHLGFQGDDLPHERLHLLGRHRLLVRPAARLSVNSQQVLTRECSPP